MKLKKPNSGKQALHPTYHELQYAKQRKRPTSELNAL